MNNYQNAKHASYKLMVFEADNYQTSVALIPKFATSIARLKAICAEIEKIKVQQEKDITGITGDKHHTLEQLIDNMVDISGALQSYAHEKVNKALYERINYSEYSIEKLAHAEISTVGSLIIEEVDKLSPEEIAAEGISADDITKLKRLHEEFKQYLQAPRKAVIERSSHTDKLLQLFSEAASIKRNVLDKLISQYKRKDPEFYLKYNAASNVIQRRGSRNGSNGEESKIINEEVKA